MSLRGPVPTPREQGYRMPAEWEPQESVWLVWPRDPVTWPDRVALARATFLAAMKAITPHQRVDLVVHPDLEAAASKAVKAEGIKNVKFHAVNHQDSWIRDYGPIYLVRPGKQPGTRDRIVVRFEFNAWGNKYESLLRDKKVIDQLGDAIGSPLSAVKMVLEGGSVDVDGQGTLITTEQCLLNKNRNHDMTRPDIERHLREYLGVEKVLWLADGIAGDDTDGHVDDITRFVGPRLVVTCVEEDRAHPNYEPLAENRHRLSHMTDAHNRSIRIVELPMPKDLIDNEGNVLPASHGNFLITNGAVLMPTFASPTDDIAQRRLQQCFKDRPVVKLPCQDLVWGMGAIHCLSQQMPSKKVAGPGAAVDDFLRLV